MAAERGMVVKSKAGHDQDEFFTILSVTGDGYAFIADGKRRKLLSPKKKKLKHLQFTKVKLAEKQLTTDKQIRIALSSYCKDSTVQTSLKEGYPLVER